MMRLSHMRPLHSKKRITILIGILLIIIMAGSYTLWSKQMWDAYQPAYIQRHQTLKDDIDKLIKAPTATPQDRKAVLGKLENMTRQIDVFGQKLCDVHPAAAWQAGVWRDLKSAQNDCSAIMKKVAKLGDPLQRVTAYIQDDNKLALILTAAPQPGELADDTWAAQAALWKKTGTDIENMSASSAFTPVKKLAVTNVTTVKDAWRAVSAAHQAKDKVKYLAAQDGLAHALDGLNEITVMSEKELLPLTGEVEKAINEVINDQGA
jgi:hypothetical protein